MSEYVCRIERLQNGFEVEINDPEIAKQNKSSKGSWRGPMVGYVFKDVKEVLAFLEKNLDKAMPGDESESSFDKAVGEEDDE